MVFAGATFVIGAIFLACANGMPVSPSVALVMITVYWLLSFPLLCWPKSASEEEGVMLFFVTLHGEVCCISISHKPSGS